jgi:hypothetical protein
MRKYKQLEQYISDTPKVGNLSLNIEYIYIYPITCWPHCSYFSREAWRPNSELPLPGLQHLWHCLSASAKPSTGEGRFLGQWEPQNCFDPWAKNVQHPSVSKKHGHGSTGMMFHIFLGVNIHWKQFRTIFWCDNQVLNHTHHGEKTEDIALLFAGEPKNGGIGESWGLPPNHPLPIVTWGSPHFEKPTSDRTLDFHWTFQVQENRSTWTGWNAISTCNWAKYGANNDSRFLMVVYPRQHQLRCTWFRPHDEPRS